MPSSSASLFTLSVLALSSAQPSYYDSGVSACVPGSGHDHYPFCNTSLPLDQRVKDLVSRIPSHRKPNLLTARGQLRNRGREPIPEVGVPSYYWGSNCIHSSMFSNCTSEGRCSTSFPSGPSWAATFDRELMKQMATVVGVEFRAGWNLGNFSDNGLNGLGLDCWGPVINMNRDPRWGRNGEGGSECPTLSGELAKAWTVGLQQGDGKLTNGKYLQVAVTLKHFDANSLEGGPGDQGWNRHTVSANISKYLLSDYYWPAFKAAIRDAGARGVMCSYNSVGIDGADPVPTCADPLMAAARRAWGFEGYVTSDSDAVADVFDQHHFVSTAHEASCLAVGPGECDIDSGNTYYDAVGNCSEADIDRALFNTMRVRFELGLFDPIAQQPLWKIGPEAIGSDRSKALNLKAAESSLVLLRNPGVLPLTKGTRIAVIGPHANATQHLIQVDTGQICPGHVFSHNGDLPEYYDCVQSPLAAIRDANVGGTTVYTQGCQLAANDTSGFDAALANARAADVIVLGLGIFERKVDGGDLFLEQETHDRVSLELPEIQLQLAEQLIALGKPTVVFLLNGGMVAVGPFLQHQHVALIEAFYPGAEGGAALASSIFGMSNRWGRLPYTIYAPEWAAANSILDHDVTHKRTYRYGAPAVLPFGFGLSLSTFQIAFATPPPNASIPAGSGATGVSAQIAVQNTGNMVGDVVVVAFFSPVRVGFSLHPVKSMFDFVRVSDLAPGSTQIIEFTLGPGALLLASPEGDLVSAPGEYTLSFENGAGQALSFPLSVTGQSPYLVEPFPHVGQTKP